MLAHLTAVLPYVVLVLTAGFGERLADLEEMARTMGLGSARRLLLVTLPATRPILAAASLLGFLVSWSQYGLSLAVGGGLPMLPLVLLPFVRTDPQAAAALALLLLAPALATLAVAARALPSGSRPFSPGHRLSRVTSLIARHPTDPAARGPRPGTPDSTGDMR